MANVLGHWRRTHPNPPRGVFLPAGTPFVYDVISVNECLPTAAGLASSASGYSALAFALARLYEEPDTPADRQRLTTLARLFGGFVRWNAGIVPDGSDSIAEQIAPETHWPELRLLICVVSGQKKAVSSTNGMQSTVQTSKTVFPARLRNVPGRLARLEAAYLARDFGTVARLMMEDSDEMHAACADSVPPFCYLTATSEAIKGIVRDLNCSSPEPKVGYTFDAGPNAVLLTRECHLAEVEAALDAAFGRIPRGEEMLAALMAPTASAPNPNATRGRITGLILTQVGSGPQVVAEGGIPCA
ncbi:putative Diphosphomevalonate decarboxylase [Paratrimastix pyriformis]|uniref:Diphosphomevalonate decarboxylase n=1 Tax=Paratrimastix pyriformis TaxID=342808 RepID=A0ABQ8USU2_9EUKA|nr:putative Diphosphomevalonate decarboxylase [Paratrimastix pyriformis]